MAIRASVNVSITPQLERFVQDLVASGRYHSASEVFREGLRLLERAERQRLLEKWLAEGLTADEREKLPRELIEKAGARIEAKIREGLESIERGDLIDGEAFFERWKSRLRTAPAVARQSRIKRRR